MSLNCSNINSKMIKMTKKPFSIRVEEEVSNKFKAISTVMNVDGAELLTEIVNERADKLKGKQLEAYESLLIAWGDTE